MDILLSHGYFLQEDPLERAVMKPYAPLGLLYLSSYLKSKGYQVGVFDSTFSNQRAFEDFVQHQRPPVVGLYSNLMTRRTVLNLIRICRQYGCRVVVGGPEPANYATEYLLSGSDIVVVGEGEQTLEELLRDPEIPLEKVKGIVFENERGEIVRTAHRDHIRDLNCLPFPDREAIDIPRYLATWKEHHGHSSVSLITSRGCPYTCNWCSHGVFGYSYRARSASNVADEIEQIVDRYRPDRLWYADDVFTMNYRWVKDFADEMEGRGIHLPFETISREDRLDEEIIATLARLGCSRLWVGSESGSQRILDAMERHTRADRVVEIVHALQRHGIEAGLFVMLGYDGEELTDIEATLDQLKRANPDQFLTTVAYPIKGTPYYDKVSERVFSSHSWHLSSDRQLNVAGSRSRNFYTHVNRWFSGEMSLHRSLQQQPRNYPKILLARLKALAGRLGMHLTRHQSLLALPEENSRAKGRGGLDSSV